MTGFLGSLNRGLKGALHNWVVLSLLMLSLSTSCAVAIRFLWTGEDVPAGVLSLVLYELGAVLSALGVVGGMHTLKAVRGVEGEPAAPPPGVK